MTLPAFIDFISPYFTDQYENLLSRNFRDENLANVKLLLSIKPIVNETYFEKCFKSTYSVIKESENEIIQITTDISNKRSHFIENNFISLPELIGAKVNVELLNLLPPYFQSLRNQFAQTIRSLARDINNDPFNKYKPAYEIIEIANNIITDGLVKQTITKGYYTIKKNYEDSRPNLVKSISQPVAIPKTVPFKNKNEESEEGKEIEEAKAEKESKGYVYWIFMFLAFSVGIFYLNTDDDVTDKKFQFEDNKRKIAQEIDNATRGKRISLLKMKYNEDKDWCKRIVEENGNDHDHKIFGEIVDREQIFLNSITPVKIMEAIEELLDLGSNILWKTPTFLEARYKMLIDKPQLFNDQEQAKSLIEAGNLAITNKNYDRLREVNFGLISLLPKSTQQEAKTGKIGFRL